MKSFFFLFGAIFSSFAFGAEITLPGAPIQIEWADVNDDGRQDLVALMVRRRTEGNWDTWFEDGGLRGLYEDETFKDKYLSVHVAEGDGYRQVEMIELGSRTVLSFALEGGPHARLMLWTDTGLITHHWTPEGWSAQDAIATPGLLASESVFLQGLKFWHRNPDGASWIVPDLDGLHIIQPEQSRDPVFFQYPQHALQKNQTTSVRHIINVDLPRFLDIDGDGADDLYFHADGRTEAWRLGDSEPAWSADTSEGVLRDINGDGMADLVTVVEGDVERPKDLPKIKSKISVYHATAPLQFPDEPDHTQRVPGFIINDVDFGDDAIIMPNPFLDINKDGKPDLAGFAFKFSMWQVAKVVATGRFSFKFLLHLSVQEPDGHYRTLDGGPFEITWRLNIRRLKIPDFAQITGDFDGDGWIDVMVEKKKKLEITPVTSAGFQNESKWTMRLPKNLRDPDQVIGRDLNNDGKSEFVVLKINGGVTHIGVLESKR